VLSQWLQTSLLSRARLRALWRCLSLPPLHSLHIFSVLFLCGDLTSLLKNNKNSYGFVGKLSFIQGQAWDKESGKDAVTGLMHPIPMWPDQVSDKLKIGKPKDCGVPPPE
jgi:hypothetical protein